MPLTRLLSEALTEREPEPVWVMDGYFKGGEVSGLIASPGAGKSTFCRSLVAAVALGRRFLGQSTSQGKALLLAMEDNPHQLKQNLLQLGAPAENIFIGTNRPTGNQVEAIRAELESIRPAVAVFDTWGHISSFEDRNNYDEVYEWMCQIKEISRATGTHIVFTHHAKKKFTQNRVNAGIGSSAFEGGVDALFNLDRRGEFRVLSCAKMRNGREPAPVRLTMHEDGWVEVGESASTVGSRSSETRKHYAKIGIVSYVALNPGCTQTEAIAEAIGSRAAKLNLLKELVTEGQITQSGTGRSGSPYTYKLTYGELREAA